MSTSGVTYNNTFKINCNLEQSPLEQCRQRYTTIRRHTHELLEEEITRAFRKPRIDVTHIDDDTLDALDQQWDQSARLVKFDWRRIMKTISKTHPRALEMAFWNGKLLCGLAVARLSDSKTWLSITHIEGCPAESHPLKSKVVPVVIAGAQIYATQVQLHDSQKRLPTLRIMRPLKGAEDWYKRMGYSTINQAKGNGETYKFIVADTRSES